LESIGGHKVTLVGKPRLVDTDRGKAIEFDGQGDGLIVAANPLAGLKEFTVEVIFRPAAGGPKEQRFLHFQADGSEDRVLFETRLTPHDRWFLDTDLQSGKYKQTLYAEKFLHPLGKWHHAAIVVDGRTMRHYVAGNEELTAACDFVPLADGQTSIGMRVNRVFWYQGAIRQVRITPFALKPGEFATP
jgi:hypothetical protein